MSAKVILTDIPFNELIADRCDGLEDSVGHGHIMFKGYIELPFYPSKIWHSKTKFNLDS